MKWLHKLEYKFGRYYIPRLMLYIVAGMAIVFIGDMLFPGLIGLLTFSRQAILAGQVWRVLTFIFVPGSSGLMLLLYLYMYYFIGTTLESMWGGFRFNIYYLVGILGAIAAGFITGGTSNSFLNLSMILAFATLAPDTQFRLFFILPIKASWLAIGYAALLGIQLLQAFIYGGVGVGLQQLVTLAFSLANYLLFFGGSLVETVKNQFRMWNNRRNWNKRNR